MMTSIPEQHQLTPQALRQPFDGVLGGAVRRRQRIAVLAGDRADHHDPPLRPLQRWVRAEQRPEGLRRDDRADDVDVHLAAEIVDRQFQDRPRDRNAGIVDEPRQRVASQRLANLARSGEHGGLVGNFEQERREVRAELTPEPVGVGLLADAAEDAVAAPDQKFRTGPADAGGRAGDDDRSHRPLPSSSRDHGEKDVSAQCHPTLKGTSRVSILKMKRRASFAT